jgi:hypothetical protein
MIPDFEHSTQSFFGKEILFRTFQGIFTADKEIQMLEYALEEGLLNDQVRGMVIDLSAATFDMEPGDVNRIVDFVSSETRLSHLIFAIIVGSPDQIIHPLLGSIYNKNIKLKPFSTRQAAIQYIITS